MRELVPVGAIMEDGVASITNNEGLRAIISARWLSVALIVVTALPWSLALGVLGVWLIDQHAEGLIAGPTASLSSGIAAICASQIVFLMCIADRVFPRTHKSISRTLEGGLGLIFIVSACVLAVSAVMGW